MDIKAQPGEHAMVIVVHGIDPIEARKRLKTRQGINPVTVAARLAEGHKWSMSVVDEAGWHSDWEPHERRDPQTGAKFGLTSQPRTGRDHSDPDGN